MGLEEAEDAQAAVVCVMAAPFMMSVQCVFCEQAAPSVACDMHTSRADIIPLRSTGSCMSTLNVRYAPTCSSSTFAALSSFLLLSTKGAKGCLVLVTQLSFAIVFCANSRSKMKQHHCWYLSVALFLGFNVAPLVYGFSPLQIGSPPSRYISTDRYAAEFLGTATRFSETNGDDSVEEVLDSTHDMETNSVIHPSFSSSEPIDGIQQTKQTNQKDKDLLLEDERTLYQILEVSPLATRDEIKKRYVKLARETHPDATVGLSPEERSEKEVLFTEVAAAWGILSDKRERQRYDRSLKAKEFTRNVERVAGDYVDTGAKTVSRVLESLFQATSGTEATSFDDAVQQVRETREVMRAENEEKELRRRAKTSAQNVNVVSAIASAINQGRKFTRAIDRYELLKKSRELEQISMEEIERSMAIKGELANVMNKRLSLSLRTPNSALTSSEALKLLDGLNTIDSVTLLESIRRKHPLINHINCLEEIENEYADKLGDQTEAQQQLTEMKEALWKADLKAQEAVEAEKAARRALEEAQRQVITTRKELMDWNRDYADAECQHRRTTQEMEKISLALERKQERVRTALRRKEEEVLDVPVTSNNESLDAQGLGLSDLERLRKEEGYLRAESNRLDDRAKRLRSRARKLKRRCEELKAEEERSSLGN